MKIDIKHANELVDFGKNISQQISELRINENVDYSGCSRGYVYEKIHGAIRDLEWIVDRIAKLNGDVVRCEDCGDFEDDLDALNCCYNCSEDEEWREKIYENS